MDALYWSASVFLWLFFTGLGLPPVPEEAGILYAAGVTSLHPDVRWWMAWPAAGAGIVCADMALYGVGRWWGPRVFELRWVNRVLAPERRQRLERHFHGHGTKFLLLARLLPPLRTGVFLIAGSLRFSFARFLFADAMYGVVGVGLIFFGGQALLTLVHEWGGWLLLVGVAVVGAYGVVRYYRYLRKLELKATVKAVEAVAPAATSPPNGNGPADPKAIGSESQPATRP